MNCFVIVIEDIDCLVDFVECVKVWKEVVKDNLEGLNCGKFE